jgi:drug/metabolite transporter (DMT)-like permease
VTWSGWVGGPVLVALLGACASRSPARSSGWPTSPGTAAVGRCLFALPLLLLLARREDRGSARSPGARGRWPRWPACSSPSTSCCGTTPSTPSAPGSRTVLGNLQVLVVGVVAWWLLGERPHAGLCRSCRSCCSA